MMLETTTVYLNAFTFTYRTLFSRWTRTNKHIHTHTHTYTHTHMVC